MKTHGGGGITPLILNLGTRGDEWSASHPATLPQQRDHGTHGPPESGQFVEEMTTSLATDRKQKIPHAFQPLD